MSEALTRTLAGVWLHPEWAPLAAGGVAVVAIAVFGSWARARRRAARLLGDARLVGARRLARDLALLVALAAIAAAALGPRLGTRIERLPGSGVDVVLLFDVSRSMDATDVPPSRLARARALGGELLARLGHADRAALAAFGGRGVLLTPLTSDHDALAELVRALDGELLGDRASNLGEGVGAALGAFEAASERPRVLVVLSDGEDPAGGDDAAIAALARAGVRLVAIALGSEAGGVVPDGPAWLRDRRGRPVVSRRDSARLARWAAADGALFVADRWGGIDLAAAAAAVRRDAARAPGAEIARRVPALRSAPPAALAFALLWLEWTGLLAAPRRAHTRPPRRAARWRPAASVALGLAALALTAAAPGSPGAAGVPPELRAGAETLGLDPGVLPPDRDPDTVLRLEEALRERPGDAALLVALGVARAERGDAEGAAHALRAAALGARDPALAGLAWYDLGVLALDAGRLAVARDAFLESLALAPDDGEARFNLEWTLEALAAEPPPPPASDQGSEEERSQEQEPGAPPPGAPEADAEREEVSPQPDAGTPPRYAPELTEEEVERWLDEVDDAAGAALRAAAGDEREQARRQRPLAAW